MGVFKRGKYWHVKFRFNNRTYTKSSRSILKRDALDLERQLRQKLIDTLILGRREHITLYAACDALLSVSKESGAYETLLKATKRFKFYFCDIYLDKISNRDLCGWVSFSISRATGNSGTT